MVHGASKTDCFGLAVRVELCWYPGAVGTWSQAGSYGGAMQQSPQHQSPHYTDTKVHHRTSFLFSSTPTRSIKGA